MKITNAFEFIALAALLHLPAAAEDVYYQVPLGSLTLTAGAWPEAATRWSGNRWQLVPAFEPHAVLDTAGEAYVGNANQSPWEPVSRLRQNGYLAVRATAGSVITGRLYVPQSNLEGMAELQFRIPSGESKSNSMNAFYQAKLEYYQRLQNRGLPGAAWFRHQAMDAAKHLGTNVPSFVPGTGPFARGHETDLEDSYSLFTGGRALSENLQLDRVLPATQQAEASVDLTNLTGITVKEMNWRELLKDAKPDLDPLAAAVPADQYAVLFPSFQALTLMVDEADANGTPILQLLEPRSEDAGCRERYQKQLCLGLSEVARMLGPQVVDSVAFTGSDPFLRVGTDVAVLFQARNAAVLKAFLAGQQKMAQTANPAARAVEGTIDGVSYSGAVSPDRSVSAYVASVSNVVIVSNSKYQLTQLVRTALGKGTPLRSQDEYVFFRSRYPRSDKGETALVVLTDATIRRWCGPKWRIADSRRTRAAAVLAELEAGHLADLVSGKATDTALTPGYSVPDAGEFRLTRAGVNSSTYGSLAFMTPIAELSLEKVTQAEADAYRRWRDSYQQYWRQFFDPLALRFSVKPDRLGADVTVTPLIVSSDYNRLMELGVGAQIAASAGDPHSNSLLHLVFAINPESQPVQEAGNFIGNMAPGLKVNAFGWMGSSIALYADDDPFWGRLTEATNTDDFMEKNFRDLPVGLYCEVKNPLALAGFLSAVHAFVDQSAPNMATWQNLDYHGQAYVKVTSRPGGGDGDSEEFALYYSATPRALIVTLSEPLLKRALDRQAARGASGSSNANAIPEGIKPWLGRSLCAVAERKFFDVLQRMSREMYEMHLQLLAWNNLPILNEWKRLYPDQDPVKFQEQYWGTKLLCPGGGSYVWDEKWHTMKSTLFGHPGDPKSSPPKTLDQVASVRLGVTFENQGLAASGILERKPGK